MLINLRKAILAIMSDTYINPDTAEDLIERSTWGAAEDLEKGLGWAGGGVAVICHEHGLRNDFDVWMRISDMLPGYWIESINPAISVLYKEGGSL